MLLLQRLPLVLAWHAATAGLLCLAGLGSGCSQTLNVGSNSGADACVSRDGASAGCAAPNPLLDGLIGHWRFDDGTGSTVAVDSSGTGNQGTLRNLDPNTAWVTGRALGAVAIAHTGWVEVPDSPSIHAIVDHVTISAWVFLEGTITPADLWGTALSRQMGTTQNQYYHISLDLNARPSLFITTDVGYILLQAQNAVSKGEWTHMAGTFDGAVGHLYVNGTEVANQALTGTFAGDTTPVILGGNGNDASGVPTELFPGRMDELMLYARSLSAAEIARLAAGDLFPASARDAGRD